MNAFRKKLEPSTLALAAIVLGSILVGIIAYDVIANIRTQARAANNARLDLQAMLVIVVDQETGLRGYAATGQRLFLEPKDEADRNFVATLERLRNEAGNSNLSSITDDLAALVATHDRWEARVVQPILARTKGLDTDGRLREGKAMIDSIRGNITQARSEADATANRLSLEVQEAITLSILTIVAITIVLGVVAVRFEHQRLHEEKMLRAQVDERNLALERSNESLREFAYVASHDLQEPLRTIASFTQLLQKRYGGRLDADADEFIGYVVDGAKRMQQLIDSILEYSRVSTHGKPLVALDLEPVARRAVSNLRASIEERDAEVMVGPLPRVMGDEIQLGQLLQNLIGNGLKYNRSTRPRVEVRASPDGPGVWAVTVADNGIGIDPEYHERIFRIFSRLHTRDEYGGTGIGLAVCKRIVDRHGGRLMVESEEGRGAAFTFTLAGAEEGA